MASRDASPCSAVSCRTECRVASVYVHRVPVLGTHAARQLGRGQGQEHAPALLQRAVDAAEDHRRLPRAGWSETHRGPARGRLLAQPVRLGLRPRCLDVKGAIHGLVDPPAKALLILVEVRALCCGNGARLMAALLLLPLTALGSGVQVALQILVRQAAMSLDHGH